MAAAIEGRQRCTLCCTLYLILYYILYNEGEATVAAASRSARGALLSLRKAQNSSNSSLPFAFLSTDRTTSMSFSWLGSKPVPGPQRNEATRK